MRLTATWEWPIILTNKASHILNKHWVYFKAWLSDQDHMNSTVIWGPECTLY